MIDPEAAPAALVADVAAFGARLRAEGVGVDAARLGAFARACAELSMARAYWIGRATLVSGRGGIAAYDRAFLAHYGASPPHAAPPAEAAVEVPSLAVVPPDAGTADDEEEAGTAAPASLAERLKHKRFEDCTEDELRRLAELSARIAWSLPLRPTRRRRPSRRGTPDVQRTLRRALRSHGELWEPPLRHERRRRRRPLVLLLDVSGSMAAYSRVLLFFAHGALTADGDWEAFCFGTRLTRLTPALRRGHPDAALRAASREVADWHGGTRIGPSLKALLDGWGHTRALRGSVVVVCSDGLEIGDPNVLGDQMERLSRLAREVVWLNPLKGLESYEPLARGMSAALPHVDVFAGGDTLASLERIVHHVSRATAGGRHARIAARA